MSIPKLSRFLPGLIISASVGIRLAGITRPLLGNFAVYGSAQAMIARFFLEGPFSSLLYPRINVLVNGEPSLILLYYPISSLIAAAMHTLFGGSLDVWGRLQAVVFFGLAAAFLYRLIRKVADEKMAVAGLTAFCLFPLTIIYGQSFQNEMATIFFSVGFFWYWLRLVETGKKYHILTAAMMLTGVLLTRPNNLYLLLPALYLALIKGNKISMGRLLFFRLVPCLLLSAVIPALWYFHVWRVSVEESNIYSTMFAQLMVRSSFVNPIILTADYYKKLFDMLVTMSFTPIGFTLFVAGCFLAIPRWREAGFFVLWCLAFLGSSLLIPRKLIDHEFYLLHFVTAGAPLVGLGFCAIASMFGREMRGRGVLLGFFLLLALGMTMRYAAHPAFKTPASERHFIELAQKVNSLTEKARSRIVFQGTHTLLYYSDRYGWGFHLNRTGDIGDYYKHMNWQKLSEEERGARNEARREATTDLEYLREHEGATHFVVTDLGEFYTDAKFADHMHQTYQTLFVDKEVGIIFSLSSEAVSP
ncbi:MAG: glycosyltransferase family 39 protein [Candidatus Omnitrophota bacterium]|nr:glycosyltransferase family 39 protein [Candidatus Omnitrophota bacterium]